jgi:tRNA-splicing ligase RtcB
MTNSGVNLIDKDLAYLTKDDQLFQQYLDDILWCKNYAYLNRDLILNEVISSINQSLYGFKNISLHEVYSCLEVHCNHNYAGAEVHGDRLVFVTRKGAVGLKEGELGIIPGSMGAKSFIVKGLGNDKAYDSCSHGAGRRTKAKKLFNKEDLANQTSGVLCRKDDKVVDEIPGAYKNIDDVMLNQSDLVVPVFQLKQLICIKG